MLNTFQVAFLGIVFATALGIVIGVMRLSTNFLISRIAAIYSEIFRNIPLLVMLIFWAQAVFLKLPRVSEAITLPGPIFLSNRSVAVPWGTPTESWGAYLIVLAAGVVLGAIIAYVLREQGKRTGRMPLITLWFLVTVAAVGLVGWLVLPQPLTLDQPFLGWLQHCGRQGSQPAVHGIAFRSHHLYGRLHRRSRARGHPIGLQGPARGVPPRWVCHGRKLCA